MINLAPVGFLVGVPLKLQDDFNAEGQQQRKKKDIRDMV
jgi:hypothetical protein